MGKCRSRAKRGKGRAARLSAPVADRAQHALGLRTHGTAGAATAAEHALMLTPKDLSRRRVQEGGSRRIQVQVGADFRHHVTEANRQSRRLQHGTLQQHTCLIHYSREISSSLSESNVIAARAP